MTDLRKVLASNMKQFRRELSLTQAKLAENIDITDNYIALIESCRRFPSIKMLERIAKALHKDTLELFSITPSNLSRKKGLKNKILKDIDEILTIRLSETDL